MWNLYYYQNVNAKLLVELFKSYKLIVNNNTNFPTCLLSLGISIIYLALNNLRLGSLKIREILEKYLFLSDDKLILMEWENIHIAGQNNSDATMTR